MASLCWELGVLWPTELPYRKTVFWTNVRKIARRPAAVMSDLPTGATKTDAEYMRACVKLAKKALGHTSPNPMVGCIIVKNGSIVGHGYHPKAGEPHAEVHALREAGDEANGATAYVSLEPCNHYGRTPPCSRALVQAKVKRMVVGIEDPNPLVAGKGIETLRSAGIEVVVGVEEELCRVTNEAFIHRMLTGTPFTCLRLVEVTDQSDFLFGRWNKQICESCKHSLLEMVEHGKAKRRKAYLFEQISFGLAQGNDPRLSLRNPLKELSA